MGTDPGVERPTLTRHSYTFHLREKPDLGDCPFCLEQVGMIGNGLARLFGLDFHGCDGSNVMEPEEVRALAVADASLAKASPKSGRHDGTGPRMTNAEVRAVVALLLEMFDDASPEWAASYVARASVEDHRGDCPLAQHQGPITCDRCVWEDYSAKARRLIETARAGSEEVERLRAKNRDLHRRAQKAEGQVARGSRSYYLRMGRAERKRREWAEGEGKRLSKLCDRLAAGRQEWRHEAETARRAERDALAMILFLGLCGGEDKAEWMAHVAEVNAHALRMQNRASSLARDLDEARTAIIEARGFEALCSKGDSLAHWLTAAQGALAAHLGGPAQPDLAQTYGHSTDPAEAANTVPAEPDAPDDPGEPDFDGPTPALMRGVELLKTLLAQKEEAPLLRVRAALRSLPSSRRDLDRMGEAIRALPGSPVVGREIGDGR